MKKVYSLLLTIFLLLFGTVSHAQTNVNKASTTGGGSEKNFKANWSTDPFDQHVFIENKGQFNEQIKTNEKILYAAHLGMVYAYFTAHGVVYRYDKEYFKKSADKNADPDDMKNYRHEVYYMEAVWKDVDPSAYIVPQDVLPNYYTYSTESHETIKASLFRQITYKNLYPGIDAVYQFIKGKDGIKYSLIVHPGADISVIKIGYSGTKNIQKNKDGDLIINGEIGEVTEHAPLVNYAGEQGSIAFSNSITGKTESFKADENYDRSKTIIIDPWVTDPLFVSIDKAYDLNWDYFGNVYAYGGAGSPWQLVKINKLGAIQWTYNASPINGDYGAFTTDRVTGTCYIGQGFSSGSVLKVNSNGVLVGTFGGDPNDLDELWRMKFDPCNRDIIIAGGGTSGDHQAAVLDTDMSSFLDTVNILGAVGPFHDMALMAVDPDGNHCYIASARSLSYDPLNFNNTLMRLPLPTLSPTIYETHDSCHFLEVSSIHYVATETNGMNGAAVSPNWLYLYNSDTIRRYNKFTGVFSNDFPIRQSSSFQFGGLDVDPCDNLFVGVQDSIYVLDSTYAVQTKIPLNGTVFDVQLGLNNALYACGIGFVTQITNPVVPRLISSANGAPSSCSACDGVATVNVNCGIAPYSYKWSNGSTNLTDTGMCAGIYTVKVSDGSCPPRTDSAIVIISGKVGYTASVRDTNPGCALFRGNITAYPTGGAPPYSYLWSNGETNQEDTGLVAGTYTCTITDNTGCKTFVLVTLINPDPPVVSVKPILDSICLGSSIKLTASGGTTYSWTPALGLSCNNCAVPTASPTITTTYKVIGMDTNGCKDSALSTIKVFPVPKPIITGRDTVCSGFEDTLSATGGLTYKWSNNATTSTIHYLVANTQTITVTAYDGMCSHDTTFVIHTINPAAKITASKDSICKGDSVLLSGSGGSSYKWNTGSTATTIWVSPITTKTYTLYAYGPTCHDSAMIKIKIISPITATVSISQDSICPGGSTTITATGSGGQTTYRWNTGQTSSSIMVQDTVTRIYTVTAYGLCDSVQKTMTVTVIPFAKPIISGTLAKCKGQRDTLTVTNSVNPATYVWSDGKTTTTIYTGNINADSTFYVTAYNSLHCPVTDTFHVKVKPYPTASISYPPGCGTTITPVKVTPSGTGPFSYKWNTGSTNDTIDIFINADTSTYTVIVTADGCPISKTVTVLKYFPLLNACCDANIYVGDSTNLNASGANLVKYKWIPDSAINCDTCANIVATPTVTTTYTVIGTDSAGCETERTVTITVETPCFNLVIPNVFTPSNGGALGLDKVFYIKTKNIDSWSLQIYDRWGKEMYTSTNPDEYWDGTTKGGSEASAGVYYYIISGTCQNNTYKKAGFVQLIR